MTRKQVLSIVLVVVLALAAGGIVYTKAWTRIFPPKPPEELALIPERADTIVHLNVRGIVTDQDIKDIYRDIYVALPQEARRGVPSTLEEALDIFEESTNVDLRDFSEVTLFFDSLSFANIWEEGYAAIVAKGTFNESQLISLIEGATFMTLERINYKGYQIYTDAQEQAGITFFEDKLVAGSLAATKDVIDLKKGDTEPIKGGLYDLYASLPGNSLLKIAGKESEIFRQQLRSALEAEVEAPFIDIFNLTLAVKIETSAFALAKKKGSFFIEERTDFFSEEAARDYADISEGINKLIRGIVRVPEVRDIFNRVEVKVKNRRVTETTEIPVGTLKALIDLMEEMARIFSTPYSPPPTDNIAAAQALFRENCVPCHGDSRQGVTGLGLPLTPESLAAKSDEEIRATITNGRPNTPMPAWGGTLNAEQIEALLQFIKYTPVQ